MEVILKLGVMWLASSFVVGILVGKMLKGSTELVETPNIASSVQGSAQGGAQGAAHAKAS